SARAAWLGLLASLVVLFLHQLRFSKISPKKLAMVIGIAAVFLAITLLFSGTTVRHRAAGLLDLRDRLGYVSSAAMMLRREPLGLGIGTHLLHYSSWITPF